MTALKKFRCLTFRLRHPLRMAPFYLNEENPSKMQSCQTPPTPPKRVSGGEKLHLQCATNV
jgi:hypothetical protein